MSQYRLLYSLALSRLDPELAHTLAQCTLRAAHRTFPGRALGAHWLRPPDPRLEVDALGLRFPSPLGVAAGLDKEADWFEALGWLGFGFVEVGTITAQPQPGNPRPRILRSTPDRALLNAMGFPNPGAQAAAQRLAARQPRRVIVGVNLGKSRTTPLADAAADYRESVRRLAPHADYVAVNVSSPNTPGLRELQSPAQLRALIGEVRGELGAVGLDRPVLLKIAPDLDDDQIDDIAALGRELRLDGIIAVNTTVDRSGLTPSPQIDGFTGGGVSGPPLARRAEAVLARLRAVVDDELTLISVGGIESADDVWRRLEAGASLVQAYTAFVYNGPGWPSRINRRLADRLDASGLSSLRDLRAAAATARR